MKHQDVRLASLKTYEEHAGAIDGIEYDARNSSGDWSGCGATELKKGAADKIKAINVRIDRLWPEIDEDNEL